MKGSLHLPLRGAPQQIIYAHQSLYVRSTHTEGEALGLYRFPLHRWSKGELEDSKIQESAGLDQLNADLKLNWLEYDAREHTLWAIGEAGAVYTLDSEDGELNPRGHIELLSDNPKAMFCAQGGLYTLIAVGKDEWVLVHVTSADNSSTAQSEVVWRGSLGESVSLTTTKAGPGVIAVGLSDGRVALWFESLRGSGETWSPLFAQTHQEPICALGFVDADQKGYLLSYSEDLTLAQTRLDDLEPMPRAAKAKGLHSSPPLALVNGPLDRFYTIAHDGVRAWRDSYSNHRPVTHDEVSVELGGTIQAATAVEYLRKDLEGEWRAEPALAFMGENQLLIYSLLNPSEEEAVVSGEDVSAERGRLSAMPSWRAEGEPSWTKARLSDEEETIRQSTVQRLISWGDSDAISSLEWVAANDAIPSLRETALKAIIGYDHPAVIHALTRLLSADQSTTAKGAFKALRKAYGKESLYPMQRALSVGESAVVNLALQALGERGERGDDQAISLLKSELDHDHIKRAESARQQLERCYHAPRSLLVGLNSSQTQVKTMALHRLWEEGLTSDPSVNGRLQLLREHEDEEVRRYALAVTLLGYPSLGDLLRTQDALLHESLNKVSARRLSGEERAAALNAERPQAPEGALDERARQLLFEISASGRDDIAVYGPIALAMSGDLRALPALLALSRSSALFVRLRATRGLASLAQRGERRAHAQLERLVSDSESEVRLCAYHGLSSLYHDPINYARVGLSATYGDVRLAALSALQGSDIYRVGMTIYGAESDALRSILAAALCHKDDLILAQEARKLYLKDLIGGSKEGALALILESTHDEVRRLALSDLLVELKGNVKGVSTEPEAGGTGGGLGGQSFLFTGTLTTMKRGDAQTKVKALGGLAASSVNGNLSYLVIGDAGKAGSKLDKAKKLGVPVISESEFTQMIEEASQPATPVMEIEIDEGERARAQAKVMSSLFSDPLRSLRQEAHKQLIARVEGEGLLVGEDRFKAIDLVLNSPHEDMTLSAIESLSETSRPDQARPRLRALVADPHVVIAQAALKEALKIAEDDLETLIEEGLTFEDSSLRSLVVEAVAKTPKKMTWRGETLLRAISDGVSEIRDLAFEALKGDEVVSVAAKLLDHDHADIRDRAALTLARVGDERALSVALEALQTPAPQAEQVIAAQESAGGEFGLLDDLQWKRQVTLALSAQQRAFVAASAQARAGVSESEAGSGSEASAVGIVYAEQSLQALVSVNDQIEGAVTRAHRRWRDRVTAAVKVIVEGRFEGGFTAVWALLERYRSEGEMSAIDEELAHTLRASLRACAPAEATTTLASQLKSDDQDHSIAWALISLSDQRGMNQLSAELTDDEDIKASLTLGGMEEERRLSRLINRGGRGGESVMYMELIKLLSHGGDCPLLIAGLSSDDYQLRRRCADWISRAHSLEQLADGWAEEMSARRPPADLKWEAEMSSFESGEKAKKPQGSKPHWMNSECWSLLALCLTHVEARARTYAAEALSHLPRSSEEAKRWTAELRRQHQLAEACAKRLGRSSLTPPNQITLNLTQAEAEALAFGTYASLISAHRDEQSLQALVPLFPSDPIGARALLQMSLRLDDRLQRRALIVLDEEGEALQLSDLDRAELLISSGQSTCIERGAQLLARVSDERALELIHSDDGIGASTAMRALLELHPSRGLQILARGFESANERLRSTAINHWVSLLKAWPTEDKPLTEDEEAEVRARSLSQLEVKLLQALGEGQSREGSLTELLKVYGGKGQESASGEIQLLVSERLIGQRALDETERSLLLKPLKALIASTEPNTYKRALSGLRDLKVSGAAKVVLDRLLKDPTQSADASSTWRALSSLRDSSIVSRLLKLMGDSRWESDDLEHCVLEISGFDEPIDEEAIWEEMSEEEREEEEQRAYQEETLSALITRCVQLGRYESIQYHLNLVEAAKTTRSSQVEAALLKLAKLPEGVVTDQLREEALESLRWRVEHRKFDPAPLEALVKHRHQTTRCLAAIALAYAQNSAGVPLLMGIARDRGESSHWREQAVTALGLSRDLRAVPTLMSLFDDQEDTLRSEALEALGYMSQSEVAEEILSRLIDGLADYQLVEAALSGIRQFNEPVGWRALRALLLRAQMNSRINDQMIEALISDPTEEASETLTKVLRESDLFGKASRVKAYNAWCTRLLRAAGVDRADDLSPLLVAATELFKTDLTHSDEWEESVRVILDHGEASLWIELCFGTASRGSKHRSTVSRFESKLRELSPAPLSALLQRLAEAIEGAPNLAQMTLTLVGGDSANLSSEDRELLLDATINIGDRWREMEAARLAGAHQPQQTKLMKLWRQLIWLWGRSEGGEVPIWFALCAEGLDVELYREALFSLELLSLKGVASEVIDHRLMSCAAAQAPELSAVITRLAVSAGLADHALSDDRAESVGGLSLADWDAVSRVSTVEATESAFSAARRGDFFALNALIANDDSASLIRLLTELQSGDLSHLDEETQLGLISASARLANDAVEQALIDLAKSTSSESLQREGWRARRRSIRRRQQRERHRLSSPNH